VLKLRSAAYKVRAKLNMPVPLPYFHSLNMLQNINYAIFTYALLQQQSNLSPLILFIIILITVGMREVAAALSNPFGDDDVDFPVNKWIAQLRGMALVLHPSNVPCLVPNVDAEGMPLAPDAPPSPPEMMIAPPPGEPGMLAAGAATDAAMLPPLRADALARPSATVPPLPPIS